MTKLIIDGRDMRQPAEVKGQPAKEEAKAKAVKPSNKARKAENK